MHKTIRKTVFYFLLLTIHMGSAFDSSEKTALIKAIDKLASNHSQSYIHSMDMSAV